VALATTAEAVGVGSMIAVEGSKGSSTVSRAGNTIVVTARAVSCRLTGTDAPRDVNAQTEIIKTEK
jgi:hypothetical protein